MQAELQTALFHAFDTLNLQQMKSFNVPPVTLHGVGALAACGPQAQSRGLRHLFVMVDSFLHQAGMTAGLERSLAMKGIAMTLWPCPAGEPCVTDVCAAVAQLRDARCDGVVAFGGGSVLDAAKAVALLVANPEQTLGEMTEHSELRPRLPLIAVPTTAGTASETTINYVITDTANKRKFVAVDPHDIPIVAFVDPDLTDSMPRGLKVATGLDALTHAIEGYITPGAWSLSDCLSMQTIRMIAKNLAKSADGDIPAGEQMAYASYITGMAYSNVGLGLVHGMAHPLGGRLGVAHGVANGILLAPVMEYNKDYTGEKYRDIADAFGIADAYTGDIETVREEAVQAVHKLTVDLKNPTKISEVGATEADLEPLAHDAFHDVCTPGNPRQATQEDILAIYKSLM